MDIKAIDGCHEAEDHHYCQKTIAVIYSMVNCVIVELSQFVILFVVCRLQSGEKFIVHETKTFCNIILAL